MKQPSDGNSNDQQKNTASSSSPPSQNTNGGIDNDPIISSVLSNEIIPLPPRTIGGLRDQIPKIKQCNCRRSHCLKLYCECFAAGIFCQTECRCTLCHNVDENIFRNEAIRATLSRNPDAFRPRVAVESFSPRDAVSQERIFAKSRDMTSSTDLITNSLSESSLQQPTFARRNAKSGKLGCNCRKSNCLKKYCECFQASIYCTPSCQCSDCKNHKGNAEREILISKNRKRDEQDCLAFASAYALGKTGGKLCGTSGTDGVAVGGVVAGTGTQAFSGNDGKGRAEVLAKEVAAGGIDVFLPPYSYAVPSFGRNGDIISFGTIGRQVVGGALDPSFDRCAEKVKVDKNIEKSPTRKNVRMNEKSETDLERRWRIATECLDEKITSMLDVISKDGNKIMGEIIDEQSARISLVESLKTDAVDPSSSSFKPEREVESRQKVDYDPMLRSKKDESSSPASSYEHHTQQVAKSEVCAIMKDLYHIENVLLEIEANAANKFDALSKKIDTERSSVRPHLPKTIALSKKYNSEVRTQGLMDECIALSEAGLGLGTGSRSGFVDEHQCVSTKTHGKDDSPTKLNGDTIVGSCNNNHTLPKKQISTNENAHETKGSNNIQNMKTTTNIYDLLKDPCSKLNEIDENLSIENQNVLHSLPSSHREIPRKECEILRADKTGCKLNISSKHCVRTNDNVDNVIRKNEEHPREESNTTKGEQDSLFCNEQIPHQTSCSPATQGVSMSAVKELYILANQESSLLHELAKIIKKRALTMALKREGGKKFKL